MKKYLLIIKGAGARESSPEEMQQIIQNYQSWVGQLGNQYIDGQRLDMSGTLIDVKGKTVNTDGPFLEAKEVIAGFVIILAKDQKEADEIGKKCPLNTHCQIEVRAIADQP